MPRYKLCVPQAGDTLYGDGDTSVVADTIDQAREFFRDHTEDGEPPVYLHSYIGRCRVVYKLDVDNGDCHEDAEPGDTTIDYLRDTGCELVAGEVRCWEIGRPDFHWEYDYDAWPAEPVDWRTIPVGCTVTHAVLGSGRTVGSPRRGLRGRGVVVDCRFRWPDFTGPRRTLHIGALSILPTGNWPGDMRRINVLVDGELVAERVSIAAAGLLRELRIARLGAEWEAEQFAAFERTREAA